VLSEIDRVQVISGIYCVDYVALYNENTPCEMITQLRPDIHVKGYDYNPNDTLSMPEAEVVRGYGGEVKIIETVRRFSTSEIISLIREGKY